MYKFDDMKKFKSFCFTNNYNKWNEFSIKINKEWRVFKLDCSALNINFRYKDEDLYKKSYIYLDENDERMIFIDILGNFKDEKQEIISIDFYSGSGMKYIYINDMVDKEVFELIENGKGSNLIEITELFSGEYDLDE